MLVVGRGSRLARAVALAVISPGMIGTGAWGASGEQGKADCFADITARIPLGASAPQVTSPKLSFLP